MSDDIYTIVACTACRPKFESVWIVIDGAGGTRSEMLRQLEIHPDDVEVMKAADRVQPMNLRVLADRAAELGIITCDATAEPIPTTDPPAPAKVPAYGDLFGALT